MSFSTRLRNWTAPIRGLFLNSVDVDPHERKRPMNSIQAGPLSISQDAFDLIVYYEVGGKDYYEKKLTRPTWPGAASGVTIGFGYDIGYNTPTQIHDDWNGRIPAAHVEALARDSGVKGEKAKPLAKKLSHITVPWDAASAVYEFRTLPRFGKLTAETFPGLDKLHPHVQGALLSIVFNRGSSLNGDRRTEMRAIRDAVSRGDAKTIPFHIRKMKRLWQGQGLDGLLKRRDAEASLVEKALT